MEPQAVPRDAPAPVSRRQLREQAAEAERAQRRHGAQPVEPPHPAISATHPGPAADRRPAVRLATAPPAKPRGAAARPVRWTARIGVLAALAGVTIAVPLTQASLPSGGFATAELAAEDMPGTVEALTASGLTGLPPASLVSTDATALRSTISASRSADREPLAGCDGSKRAPGTNGKLATADLCTLWQGGYQLRADAAVSLAVLNQAFVARFGADLCISSAYRTYGQQQSVKAQKGGLAAAPGKSNHGWGLAVDFCSQETTGARWTWLNENAPSYGWDNPEWARPGGSGPYERWHWEYTQGVKDDGEYYG
ncbi:D-alanyl-D-alanine carboxypeptidase family protein [Cellulomonas sp. P22]|uniref:M15 family metallopeptidase n=1 Tax=Cellulomonas sp. P22 TaxID=3373189 RepID=UPI0037C08E24